MALFSREPVDGTIRRYLATAPAGARTEVLAAACTHQIRDLPVTAAEIFGNTIHPKQLMAAADHVRQIMVQDRDLSAHIGRKAMQHLDVIVSGFMHGSVAANLDMVFNAVGLQMDGEISVLPSQANVLSTEDSDSVVSLARLAFTVFRARLLGLSEVSDAEYRFYVELYTGASGRDVESLAYEIIAWEAVAVGRLLNTGRIGPGMVTMDSAYRTVPVMHAEGWYPNPQNVGGLVDGDAVLQRYWDGADWTDKMRRRQGRGWIERTVSLHDRPVD